MSKTITQKLPFTKANGITINTTKLCNKGNYTQKSSRTVKYVVMHYTGTKSDCAKNGAVYFNRESNIGASAHFFVDASSIWLSVPLNSTAWSVGNKTYVHAECRNSNSISIEMCTSGNYKVSSKTIENAAYLCAELCKQLNIKAAEVDKYVLRHYDVTHKRCPAQMAGENNAEWDAFKKKVKSILGGTTTIKTNNIALPTVRQGDSCPEVKTLQFLLMNHGEDCGSTKVDGIFGSKTAAALKSYQQKVFGTADCICGKNTWTKLLREWK